MSKKLISYAIALLSGALLHLFAAEPLTDSLVNVSKVRYDPQSEYPAYLYIMRSKEATGKLPCIVYIHGSAWKKQNMASAQKRAGKMVDKGYVVACLEYRPCSFALFPAQVEDSKTAVRYMRAHAAEYGVDPTNIFLWGTSSGGHTALLHAVSEDAPQMDNGLLGEWSCKVNAVVDYYGPTELVKEFRIEDGAQHEPDRNGGLLLGDLSEDKRDFARTASPLYYVHAGMPPVFVVHGDKDKVVPLEQSEWIIERFKECGVSHEYLLLPGEAHGSPGFWTDAMYDRMDGFFRQYKH